MSALDRVLRRSVTKAYLAGTAALAHHMLRGRLGGRDFRRVVVVAAMGRNNGIASGARLQWAALRELGVDVELLDATPALRNPLFRIPHYPGSAYVFHSAGPQVANLIASVLPHAAHAYRIGYWAWELPDPPLDWSACDRDLAEIWVPSAFSQASIGQLVCRPIEIVPHYVSARPARLPRGNIPFTVLTMADSRSSWSRKNPEGALRAFHAAFGKSSTARLVLKLSGRAGELRAFEASLGSLLDSSNIEVLRGHLDEAELAALYRRSDVLLSLHRAEGYGLPLNEAMAHGLPVVATGWSGNLDFMDASDSCLVPYKLVPVVDASAVYGHSFWAEPDLDAAAQALRRLADKPEFYSCVAAAAHRRASAAMPRFPFPIPAATARPPSPT
jgi:glycosyltransferase involved in cell wall biosynthesis